jgi:hypothetical protein
MKFIRCWVFLLAYIEAIQVHCRARLRNLSDIRLVVACFAVDTHRGRVLAEGKIQQTDQRAKTRLATSGALEIEACRTIRASNC